MIRLWKKNKILSAITPHTNKPCGCKKNVPQYLKKMWTEKSLRC